MKRLTILIALLGWVLLCAGSVLAADVVVGWTEPTKNTDGSTLADLGYTNAYCQVGTATALKSANVPATKAAGGGIVSTTITVPTPAGVSTTVVCWATATDTGARVSANSATASKIYTPPLPTSNAPSNITIQ